MTSAAMAALLVGGLLTGGFGTAWGQEGFAVGPKPLPLPSGNMGFSRPDPPLPVSVVYEDKTTGEALATRAVNRITDAVKEKNSDWVLGTQWGIKEMRADGRTLRFHTRRSGFPGGYVERVAADEREIWAVARSTERGASNSLPPLLLCRYDRAGAKWETVGTSAGFAPERDRFTAQSAALWQAQWGRANLLLSKEAVLFAPSVAPASGPLLLRVHRQSGRLEEIEADETLRADHDAIGVRFVWEGADKTVFLGTNIGLLALAPGGGAASWRRLLPGSQILAGSPPNAGKMFLLTAPRRALLQGGGSAQREARPALVALSLPTGAAQTLADLPPLRPYNNSAETPYLLWGSSIAPSADAGSVWLTLPQTDKNAFYSSTPALTGLFRYDSGEKKIISYPLAPQQFRPPPPAPTPNIGSLNDVWEEMPDAAVVPLALSLRTRISEQDYEYGYFGGGSFGERTPDFWLRRRFPAWIEAQEADPAALGERSFYGRVPDPSDAETFWTAHRVGQGETLLRLLAKDLASSPPSGGALPLGAERFEPQGVLKITPHGGALWADGDDVLIQASEGIFRSQAAGPWQAVFLPKEDGVFSPSSHPLLRAGAGNALFLAPYNEPNLLRLDKNQNRFVRTNIAKPQSGQLIGGDKDGLYFRVGTGVLFVPINGDTTGEVVPFTPFLPDAWAQNPSAPSPFTSFRSVAAGVLWDTTTIRQGTDGSYKTALVGYDRRRERWTTPLLTESSSETFPVEGKDGQLYSGAKNKEGFVFRFDREKGVWAAVAPRPAPTEENRSPEYHLLEAGAETFFAIEEKDLLVYDRGQKTWSRYPLPPNMNRSYSRSEIRGLATARTLFIRTGGDMWQWNRKNKTWSPTLLTLGAGENARTLPPARVGLRVQAVDKNAVWGLASTGGGNYPLVFRFRKAQRTWRFFGPADGLPPNRSLDSLISDGRTLYLRETGAGVLVFNAATDRFETLLAPGQRPPGMAGGQVARVDAMAADKGQNGVIWFLLNTPMTLARYESATKSWQMFSPADADTKAGRSPRFLYGRSLFVDAGAVFVGETGGIWRWDIGAEKWTQVVRPDSAPRFAPRTIARDNEGRLWVSGGDETRLGLGKETAPPSPPQP